MSGAPSVTAALRPTITFWVSRDDTGRSEGYVAAGGPGYPGVLDTVGRAALNVPWNAPTKLSGEAQR